MTKLPKFKIFDNSMRCSFAECARKLRWWQLGYDYEQRPSYFAFGTAWGIIKQVWYSSGAQQMDSTSPEWQALAREALAAGLAEMGASDEFKKPNDPQTLMDLWNLYLESYPNEDIVMIAPEVGFTYPLGTVEGIEVSIGGALDGYVSQEGIGVFALEEKTTGVYLSDSFLSGYTYSPQITTYIWQGRKTIGEEFQGVLVNVVAKRILSSSAKTPQFTRTFQNRTDEDLEEFERDFICFVRDFYRAVDEDYFPRTTNPINCCGGIGKSPCLFRGLCASGIPYREVDPTVFPGIIQIPNFVWEPWKRSGNEKEEEK